MNRRGYVRDVCDSLGPAHVYMSDQEVQKAFFFIVRTSWILVSKGPQDPTALLTQSLFMDLAPPIFVPNNN